MKEYAHIFKWLVDGEQVQFFGSITGWVGKHPKEVLGLIHLGHEPSNFRLKPRTHTINGIECPAPHKESLAVGTKFWVANPTVENLSSTFIWSDGLSDIWLERGLIHLTKESADANARAMLAFKEPA